MTKCNPQISIVIPVFNEEKNLTLVYEKICHSISKIKDISEVIIVNDGSTDKSAEILKKLYTKNKKIIKPVLISHLENQGKGSALRTGFKALSGKIVAIQDADLEFDSNELIHFIKKYIELNKKEPKIAVFGTRYFDHESKRWLPKKKYAKFSAFFGGLLLTLLTNFFLKTKITDVLNCYKIFPSSVVKNNTIKEAGFAFELEITKLIVNNGIKIHEISIKFYEPRQKNDGKKFKISEGFKILSRVKKILKS